MRRKTAALLLVLIAASAFGEVRPTLEQLVSLRTASAPQISPDGRSTNRYRAAVVGAGITDSVLQYATSDINHGVAAQWEFQENPWLQPEHFARANPLHSLAKVRTPTLIIHGESDERVPLPNAILLYRALKDVGTPVRLLTYPDEPHGFTNPAHTLHMLSEWLAWYRKYVP